MVFMEYNISLGADHTIQLRYSTGAVCVGSVQIQIR